MALKIFLSPTLNYDSLSTTVTYCLHFFHALSPFFLKFLDEDIFNKHAYYTGRRVCTTTNTSSSNSLTQSLPDMRKRNEKKRADRSKWLQEALVVAEKSIEGRLKIGSSNIPDCVEDTDVFVIDCNGNIDSKHVNNLKQEYFPEFDWSEFVGTCLDPSSGELQPLRAKRKRQQLSSIIHHIEAQINLSKKSNPRIVDFGAGSGHLGLLVAARNPHCFVTLVERKAYSNHVAHDRITKCGLTNVTIYHDDATTLIESTGLFDMGVSMHSCGQLTDVAIELCVQARAGFVITPCCFGQLSKPPPSFIPDSMLVGDGNAFKENMDQTTPTVAPLTNFRSLEGTNTDMFCAITSGADFTTCFEDISDEALLSSKSVAKISYLLAKRCMRVVDYDRVIGILAQAGTAYQFYLSTLRPLTCSPKNDLIVGRCVESDNCQTLDTPSATCQAANEHIVVFSDSTEFDAFVRQRTAFIPGPCVMDLNMSNVLRFTGYSSFDITRRELRCTLPPDLCRLIEGCVAYHQVDETFAVRNELVNFKKVCLHLYHRVQHMDCSLRQYSTLFFCDIVNTPIDDPNHERYANLCGATMQCKGYMRVLADMRQFCKFIASIPRHKDLDSVGYAVELNSMPQSMGCFQLLRKAEEWLLGRGLRCDIDILEELSTCPNDDDDDGVEFHRLLSMIMNKIDTTSTSPSDESTGLPAHYKQYIEKCLVARGCFKAIRIRSCLRRLLVATKIILTRAEAALRHFKCAAHCRYELLSPTTAASADDESVKYRIHTDMHGNILQGMVPILRASCHALGAILRTSLEDAVLFAAGDVSITTSSIISIESSGGMGISDLLHPPALVSQVLTSSYDTYQRLVQSSSWRWPPPAVREGSGRYMKVKADTTCFRCGHVFAKIWVKNSLVSGHLSVCMHCERVCRRQNICPWDAKTVPSGLLMAHGVLGGRYSSKCPGEVAWCPHAVACLVCERVAGAAMRDISSDGCAQCMFTRGNGEAVWSVYHTLLSTREHAVSRDDCQSEHSIASSSASGTLKYLFLDFDSTMASTKRGECPISAVNGPIQISSDNKTEDIETVGGVVSKVQVCGGSNRKKCHEVESFLREMCCVSNIQVHVVTRNSHIDAIKKFLIDEGCCTADRPLPIHQVGGKTTIKSKWDIIHSIMLAGEPQIHQDVKEESSRMLTVSPLAIFVDDTLDELMPCQPHIRRKIKDDILLARVYKFHFSNVP